MTRVLALVALLLIAGCGEQPTPPAEESSYGYTVRGVFHGAIYDGDAASISHEAIPDFMDAMRMDLRVADPALIADLEPGTKIRFRMEDDNGLSITSIEPLPDDTVLDLDGSQ